jgi:hypothetical protein
VITPPVISDVMVHVYSHATTRVQIHPQEDRVVIGLHDRSHGSGALTLFLDRAALTILHALTGSALAELIDQQAAVATTIDETTDDAGTPAA